MIVAWAVGPAYAQPAPSDPAVDYANLHGNGEIKYREGRFGSGDTRLHYVEAGAGPLIIFYHGFPSTWFAWFDQMEALKGRYRVVAINALGGGLSGKPASLKPYKLKRLAVQLDALARHLNGRKRFTLIGHDWGAALAFAYAQAYPKRLNGVIGLSAPPYNLFLELVHTDPEQQKRSAYMQRFRALTLPEIRERGLASQIAGQAYAGLPTAGWLTQEEHALLVNSLADPLVMHGGMNWYRANIRDFKSIGQKDRWPRHNHTIKAPALLLYGEADQTFVPTFLERMRSYAEKLEIVTLPGVGHWASIEKPELANAAIIRFLDQLSVP